ncbi:MAG: helical backbone metal receptor [Bdellovibrionales bacterium]|nr:helical backbone metal receptor [Bdellovibrionales bacterium]
MNVVSLVPSWTETLINSGINLVGRTRFCIHPKDQIKSVPAIGGTKSVKWDKLKVEPDLVILDKEENTKQMAESCPYPYYATHIKTINDVPNELYVLADLLSSKVLYEKAYLWTELLKYKKQLSLDDLEQQGVLKWWKDSQIKKLNLIYLIWKDPYMSVGERTFIYSVFQHLGLKLYAFKDQDYPVIQLSEFSQKNSILLFSSEPFPFHNKKQEMLKLGYDCAWINGEVFSWFGDRSFNFLNSI